MNFLCKKRWNFAIPLTRGWNGEMYGKWKFTQKVKWTELWIFLLQKRRKLRWNFATFLTVHALNGCSVRTIPGKKILRPKSLTHFMWKNFFEYFIKKNFFLIFHFSPHKFVNLFTISLLIKYSMQKTVLSYTLHKNWKIGTKKFFETEKIQKNFFWDPRENQAFGQNFELLASKFWEKTFFK